MTEASLILSGQVDVILSRYDRGKWPRWATSRCQSVSTFTQYSQRHSWQNQHCQFKIICIPSPLPEKTAWLPYFL